MGNAPQLHLTAVEKYERDQIIRSQCKRIKDDRLIAQYHDVSAEYVASIRAKLPPQRTVQVAEPVSDESQRQFERAAAVHSEEHRQALFAVYERVATERGLSSPWEAAVLLGMAA